MENHHTLSDILLQKESQNDVWNAQINGIHLWSLVRFPLLRTLYFETFNYVYIKPERQRLVLLDPKRWGRYWRTIRFFQRKKVTQTNLLAIVGNNARYPTDTGQHSFDRLHSYLYDYAVDPLIIESSNLRYWAKSDQVYESQILSQDILIIWNQIRRRFLSKLSSKIQNKIVDYADFLVNIFDAPHKRAMLIQEMNASLIKYQALQRFMENLIRRVEGQLAIVRLGNYMGQYGLIVKALHEAGFHVIEQQHGLVHRHHYAYNFPLVHTNDPAHVVHQYTPDTFLTFGEYWHQVSNIPGQSIAIGYPYLSQIAETSQSHNTEIKGQILMISASANPIMLEIIRTLSSQFPERPIVFKLHPREIHELQHYTTQLSDLPNVSVVGQVDVYQLVAQSDVVASYDGSTVLIETSLFPGKRVFYHEANLIPSEVGEPFEDAQHLVELIRDPKRGHPQIDPAVFYAKDWRTRLEHFFNEVQNQS